MRRFVLTYHGGPVEKTKVSRHKRGLKQSEVLKHGPVLTVVKDGQVLMPRRFKRAVAQGNISPQLSVSASATSVQLPGPGGVPAKTEPPTRESLSGERTSGRDRSSH